VDETRNPQFWNKWDNVICVLADQVSITSENSNMLGSAYSGEQVTEPCSSSFQSSTFLGAG
jgi:hypothetical protein